MKAVKFKKVKNHNGISQKCHLKLLNGGYKNLFFWLRISTFAQSLVKVSGVVTYVHIEFIRKDSKFKIEQNVDSFGTTIHQVTGEFNLVDEPGIGVVMYGSYDNEEGLWAYSYIVSELTKDSVKFTAKDDNNYVQIFHRLN